MPKPTLKKGVKLKKGVSLKKVDTTQERRQKKNSVPKSYIAQRKALKSRLV